MRSVRSWAPSEGTCASRCAFSLSTETILVVEDDPQVARLIALVLQRNGYKSKVVADGQSALDHVRQTPPSIIFADLTIKGMGGEALCSAIKSVPETKGIPYIVVSGDR